METIEVATIAASRHEKKKPVKILTRVSCRLVETGSPCLGLFSYHAMMRTRRGFETR